MALYPFQCKLCGFLQDEFIPMELYLKGSGVPPCARCHEDSLGRVVVMFHEVGTENTFRPYVSSQLGFADGHDQIQINSRAERDRLMAKMGLVHEEPGSMQMAVAAQAKRAKEFSEEATRLSEEAIAPCLSLSRESLRERAGEIKDAHQKEEP